MEMLYLLIAFVIGGVVGGVIMSLRKSGDEALRFELAKLQSEKEAQADKEEWTEGANGQQLRGLVVAQQELQTTTVTLSQALKSSSVRGAMGRDPVASRGGTGGHGAVRGF